MDSTHDLIIEGNSLCHNCRFAEAVEFYTRALGVEEWCECFFNRALAYTRLHEYEKALDEIKTKLQNPLDNRLKYLGEYALTIIGKTSIN